MSPSPRLSLDVGNKIDEPTQRGDGRKGGGRTEKRCGDLKRLKASALNAGDHQKDLKSLKASTLNAGDGPRDLKRLQESSANAGDLRFIDNEGRSGKRRSSKVREEEHGR